MLDLSPEKIMEQMKRPPLLKIPLKKEPNQSDYIGISSIVPFTIEPCPEFKHNSLLKQGKDVYRILMPTSELIDIINNL